MEPRLAAEDDPVDRREECLRRGLERVGRHAAAAGYLAAEGGAGGLELHGHFSLGILADGHRLDAEISADGDHAGELLDRQEDAVDRSIPDVDLHTAFLLPLGHAEPLEQVRS